MNITLIHYSAPPVVGGVESVLARQAQIMSSAGNRVKILTGRGETWDARIPVELLPAIDPRNPHILKAKASLDQGILSPDFDRLVESLETSLSQSLAGQHVVILHNVASIHRNLALTQALFNLSQSDSGPRFILWHHDLAWAIPRYQAELHPGQPWDLLRKPWPGITQVFVSKELRQEYAALCEQTLENSIVISAGLSLSGFLGLNERTTALVENLKLALAAPLLLAPVHITRRKNLEQAILTLAMLRRTFPNANLVITGPVSGYSSINEEYLQSLRNLRSESGVEDAVHFLADYAPQGLTASSVADFYRLADGLLLTSREESFGVPVLEAGLSGIPIFCTELPSLRDLAGDFATYFSPNNSPETVADLIISRLQNDPVYQMRVRVRQHHTWEMIYRRQIAPLLEGK